MNKLFWASIAFLSISGCVQRQYVPTQGEIRKSNSVAIVNAAQTNFKNCTASLTSPEQNPKTLAAIEIVNKQVYVEKDDSPNKLELMSSNAKLNEKQKTALLEVISASQKCRSGIKSDLSSFPTLSIVYENFYGDLDIVHAQLLSKKITIGEANTQKAQLQSKAKSAYTAATSNLDNQFNSAISQEQQARQADEMQRRALASQYLMNQQAINAQQNIANQQMLQNQQNNNRVINTNCTRMGNSVNCSSY